MKNLMLSALVVTLLLGACASSPAASPVVSEELYYAAEPAVGGAYAEDRAAQAPGAPVEFYNEESVVSNISTGGDRLVIQNADLSLVVKSPQNKMEALSAMATRMGGFVVSSNLYESYAYDGEPVPEGSITIRVPAERLEEALAEIKSDAVEIQNESRSGQDVTQQYTDLASRLKNFELAEQELQELMDRAEDPEDVIAIFNQLVYYREQIEVTKGQMKYYKESAALSAISIRLVAEETIKPIEVAGWLPQGVARDAIQALVNFFQVFINFLIWFILFILPAFVIMLLPLALVIYLIRKWLAKRKAKKTPAA